MQAANDSHVFGLTTSVHHAQLTIRGYALNRMCYSFNRAANRRRFKAFPEAYCLQYRLTRAQITAVTDLDIERMLQLGGNLYYLQKLTRLYGMDLYDLYAEQHAGPGHQTISIAMIR